MKTKATKPLKTKEALDILESFNKWRRGADIEPPSPKIIGLAIDTVVLKYKYEVNLN